MFDLEQAIKEWRQQMREAGIKSAEKLDELENHLREDVENSAQTGATAEQAFTIAAQSFGQPTAVQKEFAKAAVRKRTGLQKWRSALLRFIGVPTLHPIAFTAAAEEILELGGKEAISFHHDFIGTEHVLLGLLELKTGVVRNILEKSGVNAGIVRNKIEEFVETGPDMEAPHPLPFTPRVRKALRIADSEVRALKQAKIGAEHIFLGLLLEGSGAAAIVLKTLGVNVQTAREEIRKELNKNQSEV